jgi:7-cyano-7-deazaguanine reductase
MKEWSDSTILKTLSNPSNKKMEISVFTQEITFLGMKEQPDFANLTIIFIPSDKIVELKSLKLYLYQFRTKLLSYERLVDILYDDIQKIYKPLELKVALEFKPRGGISSKVEIDSTKQLRGN